MSKAWGEGPMTLHGVLTHGFPNLLMISTVQGGFGVNFVHYLIETSAHVVHIVDRCLREGIATIEPTIEAEEAWFRVLMGTVEGVARYNATCTPGYLNREGETGGIRDAARRLVHGLGDRLRRPPRALAGRGRPRRGRRHEGLNPGLASRDAGARAVTATTKGSRTCERSW